MSQSARERSRNAHHTIAVKQHKQQHATEQDTADKQTAERAHRDARTDTQVTHNNIPTPPKGAHAQENAPPKTRKPRDRTHIEHSHGASRRRLRPDTATHGNHTPHGACSLAARNALITAQPQVKGNHPNTPQQGSAPTQTTRRAAQAWPRQGKDKSPRAHFLIDRRKGTIGNGQNAQPAHEPQRTAEESNLTLP